MMRWLFRSLLGLVLLLRYVGCLTANAAAEEIWFTPPDNLPRSGKINNEDFPELFTSPFQWREALNKLSAFGFNGYFSAGGPQELTKAALSMLRSHGVAPI